MIKTYTAALLLFFTTLVGHASEPLASPQALEKELMACLKSQQSSNCMANILGRSILPGNDELIPVAAQMDDFLVKWLGDMRIYAIHPLSTRRTGDIFEKRTYMIEKSSGALMVFTVSTLKRLGNWYVFQFNLNSTSSEVTATLKGE